MSFRLSFAKPKKVSSTEEHNRNHSSDCGVPGTYAPNMSKADQALWRAKVVGAKSGNHQVEIRRTLPCGTQMLIIVNGEMPSWTPKKSWDRRPEPYEVKISANGPMFFSEDLFPELDEIVDEARKVLDLLDDETPQVRKDAFAKARKGIHPVAPPATPQPLPTRRSTT